MDEKALDFWEFGGGSAQLEVMAYIRCRRNSIISEHLFFFRTLCRFFSLYS